MIALAQSPCRGESPPDIVLERTDDMGYSDLGCYGGEIETPHLDELASGGLRFTNFYSENMCWVSRAAMLTGVWHRTSFHQKGLHPRCVTIPEILRDGGYSTLMSGKWHLGWPRQKSSPTDRGFDSFYGIIDGASSFFAPASLLRDKIPLKVRDLPAAYYIPDAISDNAVEYIEKADRKKPLLLYVAYTAAHWPLHARPEDIARYKGKYAKGWDKLRKERHQRMKKLGIISASTPLSPRHPNVPPWQEAQDKDWQQRRMEVYAAQITSMDAGIGRIVKALERRGNFDNTLILYMTDNGGCHVEYGKNRKGPYLPAETRDGRKMQPGNIPGLMPGPEITYQSYGYGWANVSNTPYRLFKQFDHEGGIRTPLIAHWPRGI
ncbi:MAG: sulfatase-like hydrolase/transferase, partial [Planctomycetes bacterium]|nr:sulfatase-like hydrolase/transferase [Planctomycetota bacterium]